MALCVVLPLVAAAQVSPAAAPESPAAADRFAIPASDDDLPGVGPIRRYPWFEQLWRTRRAEWAAAIDRDRNAVVLLGDSITQGWNDRLAAAFPGMKVANRGISGDTTRGLLVRLEEDVLALDPAAVVLLIGTNDLEEGATPAMIASNVGLLLDRLEAHDPAMPIVVNLVFPSSATMKRPAAQIREINQRYLALVRDRPRVIPLETWRLFADRSTGDATAAEFPDLLHPNDAGYAKWAASLRPVLEALGFLPAAADAFQPEEGFEPLFNGRNLDGWQYRPTSAADRESARRWQASDPAAAEWPFVEDVSSWDGHTATTDGRFRVVNGRIVVATPPEYRKIQQLWHTRAVPGDFVLKLEFRATPFADGGLYLRGAQLQVRDYGLAGPYTRLTQYRPQDWNELVVTVRNGLAEVTCNGEVLETAFEVPADGLIGLEGDRGQIEYRRIRISTPPPGGR